METPEQRVKSFNVNNKDTRMTLMTLFGIFIVSFEQIPHMVLMFSLLNLN